MRRGFNLRRLTLIEDWMVDRLQFYGFLRRYERKIYKFNGEKFAKGFNGFLDESL
jgi:hypothetical protein